MNDMKQIAFDVISVVTIWGIINCHFKDEKIWFLFGTLISFSKLVKYY